MSSKGTTTWTPKHTSVSVQFSRSVMSDFATPWIAAHHASLSITNSRSLIKLMSIKLMMPSSHLILCCPFLLLPPIPPSTRVFSNESTLCMRWPKYWSFSFSISPSNEHPGLISFRMDWLDLLSVSVMFKSLLLLLVSGKKLWHRSWEARLSNMQKGQGLDDQKELVMVFLVIFPKFNVCCKQSRFITWKRWNIQHIGPCFIGTLRGQGIHKEVSHWNCQRHSFLTGETQLETKSQIQ